MAEKRRAVSELITIIDGYAFAHDRFCYMLYEVGERERGVYGKPHEKTGEMVEYAEIIGYYGTPEMMLRGLLQAATKKAADAANVKQIGDFLAIMENIAQEIKEASERTAF